MSRLLTTEGHRDVIEMREGLKGDRYDLRSPPPEPLVPRERRFWRKGTAQGQWRHLNAARRSIAWRRHRRDPPFRRHVGRGLLSAFLSQSGA